MKKLIVFLAVIIFLGSNFPVDGVKAVESKTAYIDVAAATLWTEPNLAREIDMPSTVNPVDLWTWTKSMSYEEKLWLVGNLETQALLGSKVTILEEKGDWVKVAAHGQPTPRNELGYPGWMPKEQLTKGKAYSKYDNKRFALVISPTAWLYKDKKLKREYMEVSFNTRLPVKKEMRDQVLVATPSDGMKWISKNEIEIYKSEDDIPKPTGKDVFETGKQFLGLPYLWAGMSGFGFDCSGFTHTIYKANGITIPRDSSVQAAFGTPVAKEDLQVGDLLFFAYDQGKGRVHHVGMYVGDGKMIHSPNTSTHVRIDKVETSGYGEEYAGARRYIED
ncbi:C40 family peptidase [Metabacillus arenae]|uniref:C40 family peptidase n=1 Tax=Metabacillus arenae TaxID=2771434 RepID=A0A926RWU4_9BACI|nr:C40 family peptidase [Metabacillus arenae]MBD1380296.1 C40 family peptidase [Metabacillus arenae]